MKALFFLFAIALSFQAHAQIVLNPHLREPGTRVQLRANGVKMYGYIDLSNIVATTLSVTAACKNVDRYFNMAFADMNPRNVRISYKGRPAGVPIYDVQMDINCPYPRYFDVAGLYSQILLFQPSDERVYNIDHISVAGYGVLEGRSLDSLKWILFSSGEKMCQNNAWASEANRNLLWQTSYNVLSSECGDSFLSLDSFQQFLKIREGSAYLAACHGIEDLKRYLACY